MTTTTPIMTKTTTGEALTTVTEDIRTPDIGVMMTRDGLPLVAMAMEEVTARAHVFRFQISAPW